MKTFSVVLLSVVVAGLMGCGGGGGSQPDGYNFNGTWAITYVTVESSVPSWTAVGEVSTAAAEVIQTDKAIVLKSGFGVPLTGPCDPDAGTLSLTGRSTNGLAETFIGRAVDADTISGVYAFNNDLGSIRVKRTFTMQLTSR